MDEESSDCKPNWGNSFFRRFWRKPLPHRPKQRLASKYMCCDFKLNLRPLWYDVIHRGVRVSYPQQRTPPFMGSVPVEQQRRILTVWKPYLRRLCDIFIPRVYASEAEVHTDQNEAEMNVYRTLEEKRNEAIRIFREQYGLGKPVDELAEEYISKETGWDRLREMYGHYEGSHDKYSPELREMVNTVKYAAFGVGLMGFLLGMGSTGSQFEANHYHTKWRTRFTAMRALNDAMIIGGAKLAFKLVFKGVVLFGPWFVTATTIAVYRNKTGVVEHVAGGVVGGATTGLNMGLRGIFARGVFGGAFGTVLGCALYPLQYWIGERQEDKRFWAVVDRIQDKREIGQSLESELLEAIMKEMDEPGKRVKASSDGLKAFSHQEDSDSESESEPT